MTPKGAPPKRPDEPVELETVVDVETLRALSRSCSELFCVPLRLFSTNGTLLAESGKAAAICELVCKKPAGRKACGEIVNQVKRASQDATELTTIVCFTGARYDVLPLQHAGEPGGRCVVGPYRVEPAEGAAGAPGARLTELPETLAQVDAELDQEQAKTLLPKMASFSAEHADRVRAHLQLVLESVLSRGYDALVTSKMHVAATRESYHQLKTKNAELQDAHDRLKELDGLKSSFLSTVSHELRTPLTSILGYTDMLLNEMAGPLQPEQKEFLSTIQRQGDRLLKLIRTLLDMSRLEKGTMPLEHAGVNVRALLADVVTTMTPVAIDKGVYLDLTLPKKGSPEDLPLVSGDVDRMHQVFLNLVENAVKFSAPGGYVTLSAAPGDNPHSDEVGYILFAPLRKCLEVRVADTGPGVPDRSKTRIFDAFYQLDHSSTREHAGTGLGLAIAKRILNAHDATVHVEDNDPQGAVFVVQLPLWTEES